MDVPWSGVDDLYSSRFVLNDRTQIVWSEMKT